jgi:hypothetical protein
MWPQDVVGALDNLGKCSQLLIQSGKVGRVSGINASGMKKAVGRQGQISYEK